MSKKHQTHNRKQYEDSKNERSELCESDDDDLYDDLMHQDEYVDVRPDLRARRLAAGFLGFVVAPNLGDGGDG